MEKETVASRSPLAPKRFAKLPEVPGVRIAAQSCGLRYSGRDDVMMAEFARGTAVAGVLTRSLTAASPVEYAWLKDAATGEVSSNIQWSVVRSKS